MINLLKKFNKNFEFVKKNDNLIVSSSNLKILQIFCRKSSIMVKFYFLRKMEGKNTAIIENKARSSFFENNSSEEFAHEGKIPTKTFKDESEFIDFLEKFDANKYINQYINFDGIRDNFNLLIYENKKDGKKMYYRDIKSELNILKEAWISNTYAHHGMTFEKEDVILDLGCNIGCFTVDVFDKVKQIIQFEPDDVNCRLIRKNMELNNVKNSILYEGAIVGNNDKYREFFTGNCPGMGSLFVKSDTRLSMKVKCYNINDIIKKYKPTKIKFDIKGAEVECIKAIKDWSKIKQIAIDYCFDINGDLKNNHSTISELADILEKNGFNVDSLRRDFKKNWNLVLFVEKEK